MPPRISRTRSARTRKTRSRGAGIIALIGAATVSGCQGPETGRALLHAEGTPKTTIPIPILGAGDMDDAGFEKAESVAAPLDTPLSRTSGTQTTDEQQSELLRGVLEGLGQDIETPRMQLPGDRIEESEQKNPEPQIEAAEQETEAHGNTIGRVEQQMTRPGAVSVSEQPRSNPRAADLLDHWGHRRIDSIATALSLATPTAESDDGAVLRALRAEAKAHDGEPVVPALQDADPIRILGANRGIRYGRWTGGPADTLSIDFGLSYADAELQGDEGFRVMLERAGKAWSARLADTWTPREWSAGDLKGWLLRNGRVGAKVGAEPNGETSTGIEIQVTQGDLSSNTLGLALQGADVQSSSGQWEPRFGSIEIDKLGWRGTDAASRFATLVHEIGHVLGAWTVDDRAAETTYAPYTNRQNGTWTGPNVVAILGGPAPFQDARNPFGWHDGERDPHALHHDFAHSGVCASIMAYCRQSEAIPALLPHAIDFAFLSDLGLTVTDPSVRPETYGLAGWTDHAAFTLSVSRRLDVHLADPQPHFDSWPNPWSALEVVDLLDARADAFGDRSTADLRLSFPSLASLGKARYAGGLIGAALEYEGLPPVTGDASLEVDLGNLVGEASFTSLMVHQDATVEPFAGGLLRYPFQVSENAIRGTGTVSALQADFYGPRHEDVAGTLHDPLAGLLASFGAAVDERSTYEHLASSADYAAARMYQSGADDPTRNGWNEARCTAYGGCESRDAPGNVWGSWRMAERSEVLEASSGQRWGAAARPYSDLGDIRIARRTSQSTDGDGGRGRHAIDGYTGTMEYAAFGAGFEQYRSWENEAGAPGAHFGARWIGMQGEAAGSLPAGRARWSGVMLGYQDGTPARTDPLVHGLATIDYWLTTNRIDLAFSQVESRDGKRTLGSFGFSALQASDDGTFERTDDSSGYVHGALFGPGHEEAAGVFAYRANDVSGSFGGRAVNAADALTLEESGFVHSAMDRVERPIHLHDEWGLWGRRFDENLFGAFLDQRVTGRGGNFRFSGSPPDPRLQGTPTGTSPISGSAVWKGEARAFEVTGSEGSWAPVKGVARLAVDFEAVAVNVDLTDFEGGHENLSWKNLPIDDGAFGHAEDSASIQGAFYGEAHEGAAGEFERNHLKGIFVTIRDPKE